MADGATGSPSRRNNPPPRPARMGGVKGWGAALLALIATAAIVAVALSAPVFLDLAVGLLGGEPLSQVGASGEPRPTWLHLLSFQVTVVVLTVIMADPRGRETARQLTWQPPRAGAPG